MYIFFHNENAPKYLKLGILTILKHISTEIFWFYLAPTPAVGVHLYLAPRPVLGVHAILRPSCPP